MSNKITDNAKSKKINKDQRFAKSCEVPDTTIFFSFQYITSDKDYNFEYLKNSRSGSEKEIYASLLSSLESYSKRTWRDLKLIGKRQSGGYETIPYGDMKPSIANKLPADKNISQDTKLFVFRFGHDYRIIGYKSNRCRAAMHILGVDFDYSLYDHGS